MYHPQSWLGMHLLCQQSQQYRGMGEEREALFQLGRLLMPEVAPLAVIASTRWMRRRCPAIA